MNNDKPLTLKDVAQAASDNHGGVRGRELGRIAQQRGLKLTYTTVDHMLEGRYKSRPSRGTLDALVELSGMSREDVYGAAGLPLPLRPLAEDLPPDADLLSGPQRRVVIDTVRLFAQHQRELAEARATNEQEVVSDGNDSAKKSPGVAGGVVIPGNFGPTAPLAGAAESTPGQPSEYDRATEEQKRAGEEDQDA